MTVPEWHDLGITVQFEGPQNLQWQLSGHSVVCPISRGSKPNGQIESNDRTFSHVTVNKHLTCHELLIPTTSSLYSPHHQHFYTASRRSICLERCLIQIVRATGGNKNGGNISHWYTQRMRTSSQGLGLQACLYLGGRKVSKRKPWLSCYVPLSIPIHVTIFSLEIIVNKFLLMLILSQQCPLSTTLPWRCHHPSNTAGDSDNHLPR